MKKNKLLLGLTTLAVATFALGVAACNEEDSSVLTGDGYEYRIDRPYYWGKEGEVIQLNIFTDNPTPTITWSSDKESVATVNAVGEVTMKAVGQAKIKATVNGAEYVCNLTVQDRLVEFYFDAEDVQISTIEDEYETSQTVTVTVDVNFETVEDPQIVWTTGDSSIATVNNGTVTAVRKGFTTVTATIEIAGKTYGSSLDVSVYPYYQRSSLAPKAFEQVELGKDCNFNFISEKKIEYVKIDEKVLTADEYAVTSEGLLVRSAAMTSLTVGKHSLWIAEEQDSTTSVLYESPFVVANVAIRDLDKLREFIQKVGTEGWGAKGTSPYFALDADLDCLGTEFTTSKDVFYGTFDGLGHTISNFTLGSGGRGMFGNAIGRDAKVMDFALVGVTVKTGQYGGALTGTLYGNVENVFISGMNHNTTFSSMLCNTMSSEAEVMPSIKNCIVIDNGNLGEVSKRFSSLCGVDIKYTPTIENVLVVTEGYSVHANKKVDGLTGNYPDITARYETLQQVSRENAETVLNALKSMNGLGAWTFDEPSGQLRLKGNAVYTYKIPQKLSAQFVKVNADNEVKLTFNAAQPISVSVNGVSVEAEFDNNAITFTYSATGRNEAKVETQDGGVYAIPFVLADHIVTDAESLSMKNVVTDLNKSYYILIANDIDCDGATISPATVNMRGTIDGYGHIISNPKAIKALFTTQYFYGVARDLAVINLTTTDVTNSGGLFSLMASTGKVQNCIVTGTVVAKSNAGLIAYQIAGSIENTLVIDYSALNGTANSKNVSAVGGLNKTSIAANLTNVVVVTDGVAVWDKTNGVDYTSSCAGVAKYETANLANALAAMNGVGGFTYNSEAGELYLNGVKVYALN